MSPAGRRPRLPWTQWRWDRWLRDPALKGCSLAARGLWIEMLAAMDADDEYGFLTLSGRPADSDEIARRIGVHRLQVAKFLAELEQRGVFSRDPRGAIYCRHMVREAAKYAADVANGRAGGNPAIVSQRTKSPRRSPGGLPRGLPQGLPQGSPPGSPPGWLGEERHENNALGEKGVNPDKDRDTDKDQRRVQAGGTQPALPLLRVVGGGSPAAPPTEPPPPAAEGSPAPGKAASAGQGSRLPPDWQPTEELRLYASERGLDPAAVAESFRDYWHAKPGKDARRADWAATWRIWVRKEAEFRGRRDRGGDDPPRPPRPSGGGGGGGNWQTRRLARARAGAGGRAPADADYIDGEAG